MSDLRRWMEDSPPDAIARLLDSARRERAPSRVLQRTLVALGTTSVTATAVSAAASAGAAAPLKAGLLGIVAKWGGAGVLGGTLLAGGVAGVERLTTSSAVSEPSRVRSARDVPVNPNPDLPRPSAPPSPPVEDPAPVASDSTRVRGSDFAPPPRPAPTTHEEIELIDAARARLRAGDGAGVLRLLAKYEQDFAPPHFEPEVLFLRMQSSIQRGDRAEAKRLAALIVKRYPQSPGVGQAEEFLRSLETAHDE
jgi:hypothetical protein